MEWVIQESIRLAKVKIKLYGTYIGKDFFLVLSGGEQEHIGCIVQSYPRPSLKDVQKMSATSSILNVIGHKDEFICRYVSETFCVALKTMIVCTGGVHIEKATEYEIQEIVDGIKKWIPKVIEQMKRA